MSHRKLRRLRSHEDGSAVIEFAFALPVLIMFIWGIAQIGMIMAADAGIQHALGEGARMATLFPTPTNAAVKQRMSDSLFGQFLGSYNVADPVTNSATTAGNRYTDLSITYTVTPDFLFFKAANVQFVRTKRVYTTEPLTASTSS